MKTRLFDSKRYLLLSKDILAKVHNTISALIVDLFDLWTQYKKQEWFSVSYNEIKEEILAHVSLKTIQRAIKYLVNCGFISERINVGKNKSYRLNYEVLNGDDPGQIDQTTPDKLTRHPEQIDQTTPDKLTRHPGQTDQTTPDKLTRHPGQTDQTSPYIYINTNNTKENTENTLSNTPSERVENSQEKINQEGKEENSINVKGFGSNLNKTQTAKVSSSSRSSTPSRVDVLLNTGNSLDWKRNLANRYAVNNSCFADVEESDKFYDWLLIKVQSENPILAEGKAKAIAKSIVRRLCAGEGEKCDRDYFTEFKNGSQVKVKTLSERKAEAFALMDAYMNTKHNKGDKQ